ncbi:MAG: glycosyltransferase family 2 protein [Flavobacteriales bacterium]|nr:glycosyltransferase family 2 protein [Flavobacteriales bacterium]
MTLYNKGGFVDEAVRSVLASTCADFELLVIDDASTDDGPAIVRSIKDPRIRLVSLERNSGRAAAAARGFEEARGHYIAILDADDRMHADRLREQRNFLDARPGTAVVGSNLQCFGADQSVIRFKQDPEELRAKSFFTVPVSYGSCMFRADLARNERASAAIEWMMPGEDHLFLLALGEYGDFGNIDAALTDYRIGEQNMDHGRDASADRRALSAALLAWFGLSHTEEELDAHMLFFHQLSTTDSTAAISALFKWKKRLLAEVPGRRNMPEAAFRAEVERRWSDLLPTLQRRAPKCALLHQYLSKDRDVRAWVRSLSAIVRNEGDKG